SWHRLSIFQPHGAVLLKRDAEATRCAGRENSSLLQVPARSLRRHISSFPKRCRMSLLSRNRPQWRAIRKAPPPPPHLPSDQRRLFSGSDNRSQLQARAADLATTLFSFPQRFSPLDSSSAPQNKQR